PSDLLYLKPYRFHVTRDGARRYIVRWAKRIQPAVMRASLIKRIKYIMTFSRWFGLSWLVLITALLSGCGYNSIQAADEEVSAAWSQVLNQYKRRADLVPQLVKAVDAYMTHE